MPHLVLVGYIWFLYHPVSHQVKGYTHLQRELKAVSEFLACGRELYPDMTAPYPSFKELKKQEEQGEILEAQHIQFTILFYFYILLYHVIRFMKSTVKWWIG